MNAELQDRTNRQNTCKKITKLNGRRERHTESRRQANTDTKRTRDAQF